MCHMLEQPLVDLYILNILFSLFLIRDATIYFQFGFKLNVEQSLVLMFGLMLMFIKCKVVLMYLLNIDCCFVCFFQLGQKQKELEQLQEQNNLLKEQLEDALGREHSAREGYVLQVPHTNPLLYTWRNLQQNMYNYKYQCHINSQIRIKV